MVQYANPHMQQPRGQYHPQQGYAQSQPQPQSGYYHPQHQPQPQPQQQPPMGSIVMGNDGRSYQVTPQGYIPVQDPRMMQPQQPGYGYPQPQQPQQGYPAYQAPNQPPQMPVYQPPQQATVYQNPQMQANQRNRYGATGAQPTPTPQPQVQVPQQPIPATSTAVGADMQLVSTGKTSTRKSILTTPSFKVGVRTSDFSDASVAVLDSLLVNDCLGELIETVISNTVNHDRLPGAVVCDGLLEMSYYKVDQAKYEADLFQSDAKALYKALKQHLSVVNNRYDLTYLSAVNDFMTELVNDAMYPILNVYPVIESFAEDFNDLLRQIRNNCTVDAEDCMMDYINSILQRTAANFSVMESLVVQELVEEGHESVPEAEKAIIPKPVKMVCLNYISAELGDDANLKKLLKSLQPFVDDYIAYVCTLDKAIYKVFFTEGEVMIDLIRD